jgi:hypothetical protein
MRDIFILKKTTEFLTQYNGSPRCRTFVSLFTQQHWTGTACSDCDSGKTVAGAACFKPNHDEAGNTCGKQDGTGTSACDDRAACVAQKGYYWGKKLTAATATTCTATICGVNEHVGTNACTACVAGKARAAGDDASGGNTACTAWTCPKDFHVRNNYCVACVAGKTIAAGGDASGKDTTCAAINCNSGTDQRIVAGVCTSCRDGTSTTGLTGNRLAWIGAGTILGTGLNADGACVTDADNTVNKKGSACGISGDKTCDAASCNTLNSAATWVPGRCAKTADGTALTGSTACGGKDCNNPTNCAANAGTWSTAAQIKGSLVDVTGATTGNAAAADLDCAPITCLAGTATNPTGGKGSFVHATRTSGCTDCAVGKTLMATQYTTASTSGTKVSTGAILQALGTRGDAVANGFLRQGAWTAAAAGGYTALANCFEDTCGLQQQVTNSACATCSAGKWNANGFTKFKTATNGPNTACASSETCGQNQFKLDTNGRCEVTTTAVPVTPSPNTLAGCIAAAAANTWRVCTSCPVKCIASATYTPVTGTTYAAGDDMTKSAHCGDDRTKPCNVKANCVHGNSGGLWQRQMRPASLAPKTSTDEDEEWELVCTATCGENEYVNGGKCWSDVTGLELSTTNKAACVAGSLAASWIPTCTACPAGKFRHTTPDNIHGGDTTCFEHKCPDNFIVVGGRCQACAAGKTKTYTGGLSGVGHTDTGTCDVILCAKDQHVDASHQCQNCAAGYSRPAGDDASGSATTCHATVCKEDFHVSSHRCKPCLDNEANPAGDDARGENTACNGHKTCAAGKQVTATFKCVKCPPGTKQTVGLVRDKARGCTPTLCAKDHYVKANVCTTCASGTERNAGDDESGPDTACGHANGGRSIWEGISSFAPGDHAATPTRCAVNFYVRNHFCVACPANTYAPAGADPNGEDTYCSKTTPTLTARVVCSVNQHVVDHACVACPDYYVNVAGDVANHQNTYCTKKLCAVDQKVVREKDKAKCENCGKGLKAPAGAWVGGADTACH